MKKCINCGRYEMNNNAVVCSTCGGRLAEQNEVFCPNCGKRVVGEGMNFCPVCAAPLTPGESVATYPPVSAPKKKNTGIIVLAAVLAALIIGGIVAGTLIYINNKDTYVSQNDDEKEEEKQKEDDDAAVREVVEGLMKGFFMKIETPGDTFENCREYLLEGSNAYEEMEENLEYEAEPFEIKAHNASAERSDFKIKDVEIDGDKAIVKVDIIQPDESSAHRFYEPKRDVLFEQYILENWLDGDGNPLTLDAYNNITPASQVEIEEDFEENCESELQEIELEAIEEADLETNEGEIILKKSDGEWLVEEIK